MASIWECLFCGRGDGVPSNEHVIPQWLLRHLNISDLVVTPTKRDREKEFMTPKELAESKPFVVSERKHKMQSLVSGRVCTVCNNGWMSKLEAEVMPILIPVIDGTRIFTSLNEPERFLLARWAAKTAYVHNWSSNFDRIVPKEHLHHLFRSPDSLPDGVAVFISQYDGTEKFIARQTRHWIRQMYNRDLISEAEFHRLLDKSYKISFLLGKVLLLVACWPPEKGWMFAAEMPIHAPLWNWQRPILVTKTQGPIEMKDSIEAHMAFHLLLGVSHQPPS